MLYIEAPQEYLGTRPSVFLAGGITNCPDWQAEAKELLKDSSFAVLNPRRADFPMYDPSAAEAQIKWEFDNLRRATVILFWFPRHSIQPIALYELGAWSKTLTKPIIVGAEYGYLRRQDIVIQTKLVRPGLPVFSALDSMISVLLSGQDEVEAAKAYREAADRFYNRWSQ